jgi:hypothetical protein
VAGSCQRGSEPSCAVKGGAFHCTNCMGGTRNGLVKSVRLSLYFNSRTTGRIRMKFGMGVVPRGTVSISHC